MYIYIYITWFLGFYVQIRNKTSRVSNIRWGLCPTAWRNMRPLPWRNGIRSVTRSLVSRSRVCVRRPWKLEWSPRGHKVAWQVGMGCWNPKRWPRRWWRPWLWRSFWSCRILRCWPISSGRPQIMSAGWKEWANSRRILGIWSGEAHQPLPQSCEASCLAPFLGAFLVGKNWNAAAWKVMCNYWHPFDNGRIHSCWWRHCDILNVECKRQLVYPPVVAQILLSIPSTSTNQSSRWQITTYQQKLSIESRMFPRCWFHTKRRIFNCDRAW